MKPKILIVVGQTGVGKSALTVRLAELFGGEVISADSRQVYRGLDIGTGKISQREMRGIPHHLLSIVNPKKTFTVNDYQRLATAALQDTLARKKLPIICGGSGFYIDALLKPGLLPPVPPNEALRKTLQKKSPRELILILQKLDPERAKAIDQHNARRIVRAIEIAKKLGTVPPHENTPKPYHVLHIGLTLPDEELKQRLRERLNERIKQGMVREARKLHARGLSWKRMEELGLEYRYLAQYLGGTMTKKKMIDGLGREIWRYAKRQKTWFKKNRDIKWFHPNDYRSIEKAVSGFLKPA